MKVIFDKMEAVIKDIAQAEGYAYVFEQQNAGLMVAPPSANMTNELVRRYNAKYKGAAPAKKADGKKAAPAATPAPK
jgi:outer membrane protein